jgi:hypothetical protein
LRRLHAGGFADTLSYHLAGGAADDQQLSGYKAGLVQQLGYNLFSLVGDVYQHDVLLSADNPRSLLQPDFTALAVLRQMASAGALIVKN